MKNHSDQTNIMKQLHTFPVQNLYGKVVNKIEFRNLKISDLEVVAFKYCVFENCDFSHNLENVSFRDCVFENCRFDTKETDVRFKFCVLQGCKFRNTSGTYNLYGCKIVCKPGFRTFSASAQHGVYFLQDCCLTFLEKSFDNFGECQSLEALNCLVHSKRWDKAQNHDLLQKDRWNWRIIHRIKYELLFKDGQICFESDKVVFNKPQKVTDNLYKADLEHLFFGFSQKCTAFLYEDYYLYANTTPEDVRDWRDIFEEFWKKNHDPKYTTFDEIKMGTRWMEKENQEIKTDREVKKWEDHKLWNIICTMAKIRSVDLSEHKTKCKFAREIVDWMEESKYENIISKIRLPDRTKDLSKYIVSEPLYLSEILEICAVGRALRGGILVYEELLNGMETDEDKLDKMFELVSPNSRHLISKYMPKVKGMTPWGKKMERAAPTKKEKEIIRKVDKKLLKSVEKIKQDTSKPKIPKILNLNSASLSELCDLNGLGIKTAEGIIEFRKECKITMFNVTQIYGLTTKKVMGWIKNKLVEPEFA